ncbi:MAG: DeoR/GlpR transcriptional regulator, partial [Planctomycetes bacterium]|nr:DeoR/GlpR transcriptional regulator [Planctomycetota bacterium]
LNLKLTIAQKADSMIANGSSVMAESSSTVLALFDKLRDKRELTIVSNSIKLLWDHANSGFSIIASGGELRSHSLSLVGTAACASLAKYNVDIAIFSCKGLDRDKGVTESNEPEAAVKQTMIQQAKTRILLADHTKFDQVFLVRTLEWPHIDMVVTDIEPKRPWLDFFRKNNIQLVH